MKCWLKPEHCKRLHNIRHDLPERLVPNGDRDIWGSRRSSEFWDEYYSMDRKEQYQHGLIVGHRLKDIIKNGYELLKCEVCKGSGFKQLDKITSTTCDCNHGWILKKIEMVKV